MEKGSQANGLMILYVLSPIASSEGFIINKIIKGMINKRVLSLYIFIRYKIPCVHNKFRQQ